MGEKTVSILGTRGFPSWYGGFETAVRHLAPFLAERGWHVTVYGRESSLHSLLQSQPVPGVRSVVTAGIPSKSLSTLTHGFSSALHAIRHKPDVCLVMNVANGFWLPFLRLAGIPVVVNVDGIEWERDKWSRLGKTVFRLGAWLTARYASEIVVDSERIGEIWEEKFNVTSHFIPYGGESTIRDSAPLGLAPRSYVLYVARFVEENSIDEFLASVPSVADEISVVIVGSSGFENSFDRRAEELARRHANVIWTGHLADDLTLHALWANAGAYFHGHTVGGTNPALVQAMACGAPIIARDTPFNSEVLGNSGLLISLEGTTLIDSIKRLIGDPDLQATMSKLAKTRALRNYSWPKVCSAYENLLTDAQAKL